MTEASTVNASAAELKCPYCGGGVTAPDTFCPSCEGVQPLRGTEDYFTVLGLPRSLDVDMKTAESRFYELSRKLHPDRYGRKPEQLENAMHRSAMLNDAYRTLRDDSARLDYFIELEGRELGADATAEAKERPPVPAALAEEYFELQEALSEGAGREALTVLSDRLEAVEKETAGMVAGFAARWRDAGFDDPEKRSGAEPLRREIRAGLRNARTMRQYLYRMREDIRRRTE